MGGVIGFDITPNSGSSLRKVLRLNLSRFMERLSAISVSATREHGLELTLRKMKEEWNSVNFSTQSVRDSGQQVLVGVDSIQSHMDDHRIKTQNMRGSPYFKAFEGEREGGRKEARVLSQIISHVMVHWEPHSCVIRYRW